MPDACRLASKSMKSNLFISSIRKVKRYELFKTEHLREDSNSALSARPHKCCTGAVGDLSDDVVSGHRAAQMGHLRLVTDDKLHAC